MLWAKIGDTKDPEAFCKDKEDFNRKGKDYNLERWKEHRVKLIILFIANILYNRIENQLLKYQ